MQRQKHFLLIGLGLFIATVPLSAQTVSLTRTGRSGVAIEAARPQLSDEDGTLGLTSGAFFLSGHGNVGGRTKLIMELPFAVARVDGFGPESSSAIGNPYVGLQLAHNGVRFDLGGRLPLASENEFASFVGAVAELERMEAFLPNAASVSAAVSAAVRAESGPARGIGIAVFGGPSLLIPTGDDRFSVNENELMLTYGIEPAYRSANVRAGARFLGRYITTEEGSFAERSMHQVGVFADFGAGHVRPGLHVRMPLDKDMREDLPWILGLNVQVILNR